MNSTNQHPNLRYESATLFSGLLCTAQSRTCSQSARILGRRQGQGEESIPSLGLEPLGCGSPFSEICGSFPLRPLRSLREEQFLSVFIRGLETPNQKSKIEIRK